MSTGDTSTDSAPATVKHTHPVRGILWGLLFGIGLALVLVITTVISLALVTMAFVVAIGAVLGVLWSTYGPARAPTGPPPVSKIAPPATSRFDDFEAPAPEHPASEPPAAAAPPAAATDDEGPH